MTTETSKQETWDEIVRTAQLIRGYGPLFERVAKKIVFGELSGDDARDLTEVYSDALILCSLIEKLERTRPQILVGRLPPGALPTELWPRRRRIVAPREGSALRRRGRGAPGCRTCRPGSSSPSRPTARGTSCRPRARSPAGRSGRCPRSRRCASSGSATTPSRSRIRRPCRRAPSERVQHGWRPNLAHMFPQRCSFTAIWPSSLDGDPALRYADARRRPRRLRPAGAGRRGGA